MEVLSKFGFDFKLFIAQIINFLVLAFLFKKFLYKPILKTLKDRKDAIKKGIADSEKAQRALEDAQATTERIAQKTAKEAEQMISEAKSVSSQMREDMLVAIKTESEKIMSETKKQIAQERESFTKESRIVALEVSRKILEQTITKLFDKKDQKELLEKALKEIKSL